MTYEEKFMKKAILLAKRAESLDEVPVGAVIVKSGKVIASAFNRKETSKNATAHAEVLAIVKACKKLDDFRLVGCDMYVSLEPCVMCVGAILSARIENVFFGAPITGGSISSKELVKLSNLSHKTNIEGGYFENECSALVTNYFKNKRKNSAL